MNNPCRLVLTSILIVFSFIYPAFSDENITNTSNNFELPFLTPDLALSGLEVQNGVKTGNDISGSVIITNKGPVSATNVISDFILKNRHPEGDEIIWLGTRATVEVTPGLTGKIPFSFPVPKGISDGEYLFEVTIHGSEPELFPDNNEIYYEKPVSVHAGEKRIEDKPNIELTIDSVDRFNVSPGGPLEITYHILNPNNASAGSYNIGFFLSPEQNASSTGYRIREARNFALYENMNEISVSQDLIPDTIPSGVYYLVGVADYTGMIQETDESDNRFVFPDPITVESSDDIFSDSYAEQISGYLYLKTNKYREYLGLSPLSYDELLSDIARDHSLDMKKRSYFSHYTPEGVDPEGRAEIAGYDTTRVLDDGSIRTGLAENIIRIASGHTVGKAYTGFVDPTTPEEIADVMMLEWINSPEHNKNLINPTVEKIGIGTTFDGEFFYATQDFY